MSAKEDIESYSVPAVAVATTGTANTGGQAGGSSAPPGAAPPGGVWGTWKYVGSNTKRNACIACLCCGPCACFVLLCPSDEMDAYSVSGKIYDAGGGYVGESKGQNFTPKRQAMQR
mmetsp:Transcript_26000/g.38481  ORF Transcript_26000/g.38481 Transcript_26000/m.38481 type:complete len:116 (-) Transcript_26000:168-515(-)